MTEMRPRTSCWITTPRGHTGRIKVDVILLEAIQDDPKEKQLLNQIDKGDASKERHGAEVESAWEETPLLPPWCCLRREILR